jgi:hypothetical protein
MRKSIFWSLAVFFVIADAGALAAGRPVRIVDEGETARDWAPVGGKPLPPPGYPEGVAGNPDACVAVGYLINRDGTTSDLSVLQVWSSQGDKVSADDASVKLLVQTAEAYVLRWKFEATPKAAANRVAYTSASIPFPGTGATDPEQLRSHCRITNLREFIAKARNEAGKRGYISGDRYELTHPSEVAAPMAPPSDGN